MKYTIEQLREAVQMYPPPPEDSWDDEKALPVKGMTGERKALNDLLGRYNEMKAQCVFAGDFHPDTDQPCHISLKNGRYKAHGLEYRLAALLDDMALGLSAALEAKPEGEKDDLSQPSMLKQVPIRAGATAEPLSRPAIPQVPLSCIVSFETFAKDGRLFGRAEEAVFEILIPEGFCLVPIEQLRVIANNLWAHSMNAAAREIEAMIAASQEKGSE